MVIRLTRAIHGAELAAYCHVERVFNPDRKETRWGKRKLKRDQ
jgi:hypothetical protein